MIEEFVANFDELSPLLTLTLGLAMGLQHAFESDHIAAISTQITKEKLKEKSSLNTLKFLITKSSILGALWGAGHTSSLMIVGVVLFYFAISIPESVFSTFEVSVGFMLVFLGSSSILKYSQGHRHPHKHSDDSLHFDFHKHEDSEHKHSHTSYLIGLVHGLAGSGMLVIFIASSLDSFESVFTFILFFGLGSIISMSIISGMIGTPFVLTNKFESFPKIFRYVTGFTSIGIGVSIVYDIMLSSTV